MYYDDNESEEERLERQHRRKIIEDWKKEEKAIRDADPSKRMLMREAKRESLARVEDAARTPEQFQAVMTIWDNAGIVEKWRIDKQEKLTINDMQDYELPKQDTVIP